MSLPYIIVHTDVTPGLNSPGHMCVQMVDEYGKSTYFGFYGRDFPYLSDGSGYINDPAVEEARFTDKAHAIVSSRRFYVEPDLFDAKVRYIKDTIIENARKGNVDYDLLVGNHYDAKDGFNCAEFVHHVLNYRPATIDGNSQPDRLTLIGDLYDSNQLNRIFAKPIGFITWELWGHPPNYWNRIRIMGTPP